MHFHETTLYLFIQWKAQQFKEMRFYQDDYWFVFFFERTEALFIRNQNSICVWAFDWFVLTDDIIRTKKYSFHKKIILNSPLCNKFCKFFDSNSLLNKQDNTIQYNTTQNNINTIWNLDNSLLYDVIYMQSPIENKIELRLDAFTAFTKK